MLFLPNCWALNTQKPAGFSGWVQNYQTTFPAWRRRMQLLHYQYSHWSSSINRDRSAVRTLSLRYRKNIKEQEKVEPHRDHPSITRWAQVWTLRIIYHLFIRFLLQIGHRDREGQFLMPNSPHLKEYTGAVVSLIPVVHTACPRHRRVLVCLCCNEADHFPKTYCLVENSRR